MTNLEKINSIKNRLGGMYLYLKEKPERLQEAQVRERIKTLAADFNGLVDELLYSDKEVTPEQVAAIFDGEVIT